VITMIETEDTAEAVDVTVTTMALASTATAMIDMSDEVVVGTAEEDETTIAVVIVIVAAPAKHHRQPNMVIQLLVRSLGNLMGSALLVKLHDLDSAATALDLRLSLMRVHFHLCSLFRMFS